MGKKNWIEFDNQEKKSEEIAKAESFNTVSYTHLRAHETV